MPEDSEIEQEAIFEFTTREEYINCSCSALSAIDSIDAMTATDKSRLSRIKRKCLKILDQLVGEMYDELFDHDEED